MVKHTQTIRRQFVFDHIVGLTLERLSELANYFTSIPPKFKWIHLNSLNIRNKIRDDPLRIAEIQIIKFNNSIKFEL